MADYLQIPLEAKIFFGRFEQLSYALSIKHKGLCLEFGVFKGKTTRHIGNAIYPEKLYAFDSFKGLPQKWHFGNKMHKKGHFNLNGKAPILTKNTIPVIGLIENTLPKWIGVNLKDKETKVAFIHIDVDLYRPTKTILTSLKPYFAESAIIVFDELADFQHPQVYTNWRDNEYKALCEEIENFTIIARTESNQVAIRV